MPRKLLVCKSLSSEERSGIVNLLKEFQDVFAWSYEDMPSLEPTLVAHALNVDPIVWPVKLHRHVFHPEVEEQIIVEAHKLLVASFIKSIDWPKWLANIVPVKKKDNKIRCYVDFRDLNKACPKDEFPLPNMDVLMDSAAGSAMLSFIDGFSRYNQIKMTPSDAKKTTSGPLLVTSTTLLCLLDLRM